jgi:hypothetical protein
MRCVEYRRHRVHRDAQSPSPHSHLQKPELKNDIAPGLIKDVEITRMPSKEDRMKIMESYVGIVKLKKPLTLEEIFELEEDNWLY